MKEFCQRHNPFNELMLNYEPNLDVSSNIVGNELFRKSNSIVTLSYEWGDVWLMKADSEIDFESIIMDIRKGIYKKIGTGSGRLVFDLKNGYVVKVAKNQKGIAQNIAEFQIADGNQSDFFAKIIAASEKFDIIIMEKAELYSNFREIREYFQVRNNRELFRMNDIQHLMREYKLVPQDLYRLDSWGMVHERPVIIDYGFTWNVKRKYYFPF